MLKKMGKEYPAQLSLFEFGRRDDPVCGVVPSRHLLEVAGRLPRGLYLGTSSWSFPGWKDLVYDRDASQSVLARHGLRAYATHPLLRCVGIDRTFYAPLSAGDFAAYREVTPEGFRFAVKAPEVLTRAYLRPTSGGRPPSRNGFFLHPEYAANEAVGPCVEGLGDKAAVMIFQFPPQSPSALGGAAGFADRLSHFLQALPRKVLYAVELRNPELFTPPYVQALLESGSCHCFNVHPTMPPLEAQLRLTEGARFSALVVRWMLQRHRSYGSARDSYSPFNRLVEEDRRSRSFIRDMCLQAISAKLHAFVLVNNKAEGSAPLSIFHLAEEIVGG